MTNLRTDYKDDVLNTSVNTRRKFNMVNNSDGTVSFEDATIYTQIGDSFGAFDINETNHQIEELKKSVSDGKTIVADAITAKGVETATDASFAMMAENIGKIASEASLVHNDSNNVNIRGSATATCTSYDVVDNKKYLVIVTGALSDRNEHYCSLDLSLMFNGEEVGTVLSALQESAGDDDCLRYASKYYITDGTNGTISASATGTTAVEYKVSVSCELLVFCVGGVAVNPPAPAVNLLHFDDKTETTGGVTWKCENGVITAKGTVAVGSYSMFELTTTKLQSIIVPNVITYTCEGINGLSSMNLVHDCLIENEDATSGYGLQHNTTYRIEGTYHIQSFMFVVDNSYSPTNEALEVDLTLYPMLCEGNESKPWVPYQSDET